MKDDFLWTVWQEDRTEIRLIKDRIYSICTFITVASFAVSSYLIGKDQPLSVKWNPFFLLIDISFVALLWIIFLSLKRDLSNARKCLDLREKLICDQLANGKLCTNPFLPAFKNKPSIKENRLYLVAVLATLAILLKGAIVWLARTEWAMNIMK
ncbi:MAG: hypothetical protein ABSG67_14420 [Thermoguttaceae bacterium]|jgi:uncharacterized membrane protein